MGLAVEPDIVQAFDAIAENDRFPIAPDVEPIDMLVYVELRGIHPFDMDIIGTVGHEDAVFAVEVRDGATLEPEAVQGA